MKKTFEPQICTNLYNTCSYHLFFILGQSRGTRIAAQYAIKHPLTTKELLLWGISSGPIAARFLDDYYYGKLMRAAFQGGMATVCNLDFKRQET